MTEMTFLNRKSSLREWSLLNDLRKNVTTQLNQLILTCWPFVCLHYQQTFKMGCTRWKLTCSYQIRCVVSNKRFGHGQTTCKGCDTFFKCGEEGRDGKSCQKCKNCKGDHMASSKQCPIWIKGKEIQKKKQTEKELPIQKLIKSLICTVYLITILSQL